MRKVLIALDDTPAASKVAELGYEFAKGLNGETILLHVVSKVTYYSSLQFSPIMGIDNYSGLMPENDDTSELEKIAEGFLDKTKRALSDGAIRTTVKSGDFIENLISVAKDLKVDLIVMGSHERHGIEKILVGSVAEKVLSRCPIPLLLVPPNPL